MRFDHCCFKWLFGLLLALPLLGCGSGDNNVSATGKATYNGTPLTNGSITYHPDSSQGNSAGIMAASEIDGQGNYQITAPPGWYKVTVVVEKPRAAEGADAYALPEYLTPEKYASIESTPFSIELKPGADAGAYDLELTD